MTRDEMIDLFQKHDSEYLKYKGKGPPDLAALNLLNSLCPSTSDIIAAAEHDEYWLSTSPQKFAKDATESDIVFLIQCGLRYDEDLDSFAFYA